MMNLMCCHITKFSPAANDTFVWSGLKLFQTGKLTRPYGRIQKLLSRREIFEREQNLISPCITSVCKKKVSPCNFLKERFV